MTLDELTIWLLLVAAAIFLASFAMLVYTVALLLEVRHKVKAFDWRAPTHHNGHQIRERM